MTAVEATAPGKLILFGEHAVVYARPAIAVPVADVRARALLQPAGHSFTITATDLGQQYPLDRAGPDDPLAAMVWATLKALGQPVPPQAALTITSDIPLGRGLGSGAAVSAAVGRSLAQFLGRELAPEELSALVYQVEQLHHGTPSGIDNTVITFEQPVYFIKGRPIRRIAVARPFTLVVGDTGLVAPTRQVVGDLRRRWQADRPRYEGYFDEIGAIVAQARVAIEQEEVAIESLGRLMDANQELLQAIGVSGPELEHLIETARRAGALGAKLSGAGQGGVMIALVTPQAAPAVAQALKEAGATTVMTTNVEQTKI